MQNTIYVISMEILMRIQKDLLLNCEQLLSSVNPSYLRLMLNKMLRFLQKLNTHFQATKAHCFISSTDSTQRLGRQCFLCVQVALADSAWRTQRKWEGWHSNDHRHDGDKRKSAPSCRVLTKLFIYAVLYWLDYAFQKG